MSGIDNFLNKQKNNQYFITGQSSAAVTVNEKKEVVVKPDLKQASNIRDEFVKVKQANGLIRKFYNFLKNKTNIGIGSNAVEKDIDKFEKGEITEEQAKEQINKYKQSQTNSVQLAADTATAAVTVSSFFFANNFVKKLHAQIKLDALPEFIRNIKNDKENLKYTRLNLVENILKSKTKTTIVMLPLLGILGGLTKLFVTKAERIGSKEHTIDKKSFTDKDKLKAERKKVIKEIKKTDAKNFLTGAVNGMLAPVTALAGGIVGVPAYIAAITGLRYFAELKENKPPKDFKNSFKDNAAVNTLATAAIALPALKKAHFSHVLGSNLNKAVNKLTGVRLKLPDLPSSKSAYQELEDIMLNSESINKILNSEEFLHASNLDDMITQLTEENIFAVKFLQIKNKGTLSLESNPYQNISEALRENCPPTRTIEEAQEHINKLWGSTEYTVSKLLGVGTIAETYLAKDKSGKEVCIKVLKNGINSEKIAKDKEKFIKLITGDTPADKLNDNQKYLINNINDLADGISKEVDFVNEMNAAKELKKYSKVADVVVPMEAKPGIYVMEKAPGISIKTLIDYYECESWIKWYKKMIKENPDNKYFIVGLEKHEEEMKQIKSRAPEFEAFDLTPAQIKKLLKTYIDLQVEQFAKIDKNGKVIHADIHPGNIFINLQALKSGKGKLFTLIDTGNTIKLSKEQAMASLKITGLIKNGNTKDLTEIVLQGAILPQGLTKEEAAVKIEKDLKKFFFDNETKIESMNMDTFFALSDNILRKHNIIPDGVQLNLNKAKISAKNSFEDLFETFFEKKYGETDWDELSVTEKASKVTSAIKDMSEIGIKYQSANTIQESKNLFQMSWKEALNFLRNKNNLKTNSEEYLTYKLKQNMPGPKIKEVEILEKLND